MKLTPRVRQTGFLFLTLVWLASVFQPSPCLAFEGRIASTMTRGGESQSFLCTVGTNTLRLQRGETDRPYAVNLVDRATGGMTLLFPNNRSFVRLKPQSENSSTTPPGFPAMPALPAGIGPQTQRPSAPPAPANIGPANLPGLPEIPKLPGPPGGLPPGVGPQAGGVGNAALPGAPGAGALPMPMMMPPMPMEQTELKATGETTNLLGYACRKFEVKQRGEVMEIWATDKLFPFQPYLQNQPPRFGPRMIEEQWGGLLKAGKLFPLLAVLRFEQPAPDGKGKPVAGPERMRFEVKSITPEKIEDQDGSLFQPPADYHELEPLPF